MKVSYEWLQSFFEEGALPGIDALVDTLMFHAYEIEGVEAVGDDYVIDVDVLPNRSSDSLSHRGIAREIATLLNIPLKNDPLRAHVELTPVTDSVSVTLKSGSCSHYIAACVTGVTVRESPEWLRRRLEAIGQKPINNVVDATNYVLFGLGQPTHVFDARKFAGERPHIGVRDAKEGETIVLLGEHEPTQLPENATVIVDEGSDEAVAIAGIKGGARAEVDAQTTDVIIEAATFDPIRTRLAAQTLKMRTDASARFENDVPGELAAYGADAVARLLQEIAGGELQGFVSAGDVESQKTLVEVSASSASALLGVTITPEDMEDIFSRLGFAFSRDGDTFSVTAPFERRDIRIPEDLIEEVGRVFGYEKIAPQQLPPYDGTPRVNKKYAYADNIRTALTRAGYTEVYLYSLRDTGDVRLANALASDKDHLRANLATGIIEALDKNEKNAPLLGLYDAVRIFEIGNVFPASGEETHVCVGVRPIGTKKRSQRARDELEWVRNILADVLGVPVPEASGDVLEFNLDALLDTLPDMTTYEDGPRVADGVSYTPPSAYPFVLRDIAVWVPEDVPVDELKRCIERRAGPLLVRLDLFDTFTKDGRVSYAFHLVFQSRETTLTDAQVGDIMQSIEQDIAAKDGWDVR